MATIRQRYRQTDGRTTYGGITTLCTIGLHVHTWVARR